MIRNILKIKHYQGGGGFESGEKGVYVDVISSAALSPAQVAANTSVEEAFTFTGVDVGDIVLWVEKPTHQAGLATLGGRVSAADTITIKFGNYTVAGITPTAAEVYKAAILRVNK